MARLRTIGLMLAAGFAALLSGCAPVVLMVTAAEQDDHAKLFSPRDGESLIYVYLDELSISVSNYVVIDGRIAGIIRPQTYLVSRVARGHHTIWTDKATADTNSIALNTESGQIYFIGEQVLCEEGKPLIYLYLMNEEIGRERVIASALNGITLFNIPLLTETPTGVCGPGKGESYLVNRAG